MYLEVRNLALVPRMWSTVCVWSAHECIEGERRGKEAEGEDGVWESRAYIGMTVATTFAGHSHSTLRSAEAKLVMKSINTAFCV